MKNNLKNSLVLGVAVACMALQPSSLSAADDVMRGGQHLLHLNSINTKKDVDALKNGDTIAMVCAKCKTVWITRVREGAKGGQILNEGGKPVDVIGTHTCAGCKDSVVVVGHVKGDITELKHTCGTCGGEVFCCATKPGEATKGMDKK